MPKGFKRDLAATAAAYESGQLIDALHRSFISQPKAIPGECEEPQPHLILFGADKTAQRMKLFQRERNKCQTCGCLVVWGGDDPMDGMVGEWMHVRDRAGEKCDCLANARLSCHAHHQGPGTAHYKRRPRWTSGERTAEEVPT